MENNLTFSSFVEEFFDSALKQNLSSGSLVGLPDSLIREIQTSVIEENDDLEKIEEAVRQFGGGGGCNDAYSAFGFLSFLFALLTFIQNNMRRRKRETRTEVRRQCAILEMTFSPLSQLSGPLLSPDYREGLLAAGLMYHGFLTSLGQVSSDPSQCIDPPIMMIHQVSDSCRVASLCEARVEASRLGRVARVLSDLAETHGLEMLGLGHLDNEECGQRLECRDEGQHAQGFPQIFAR